MISQSRWEQIICEVTKSLDYYKFGVEITKEELDTIVSVLKNNTPFRVVPDCCLGKTPNKETIEAMNVEESQKISSIDVLLETKNFSVLGDKN